MIGKPSDDTLIELAVAIHLIHDHPETRGE